MPGGLVLVIEDDEWVSGLLANAIHAAGYDVSLCGAAKAGLETAISMQPDCIICDVDLPDHDGYWVARNVRTQPSRVSVTPFLFLSAFDDQDSRLEGFHVGADVYMTKPFRVEEVVAQVGALVQMATRLRQRRDSLLAAPDSTASGSAIEGDLSQMSIATVLTVLEMERRSGLFEVVSKKRRASLDIATGYVVQGAIGGTKVSALTAMRTMLGWQVGRFSFMPTAPRETGGSQKSIGAFLIEAVRLEDEDARLDLDLPPSRRRPPVEGARAAPPVIGGPASTAADLSPSSSRAPGPLNDAQGAKPLSLLPLTDPPIDADWEIVSIEPDPPSMRVPAMLGVPARPPPVPPVAPPIRTGLKLQPTAPRPAAIPPPPDNAPSGARELETTMESPPRPKSMRPPMAEVRIPPPPPSPGLPQVPRPAPKRAPSRPPRPEPKKR